jgi:hypothetical protein
MQESNHQIAERLLRQRGYDNPAGMIRSVQEFISQCSETPLQAIGRLVQENQLVCIGEAHNYEGRYMNSELIEVAAIHGANVLFVEVYEDEQIGIDYRDLDILKSKTASNLYTAMVLLRFSVFPDLLGFQRFFGV